MESVLKIVIFRNGCGLWVHIMKILVFHLPSVFKLKKILTFLRHLLVYTLVTNQWVRGNCRALVKIVRRHVVPNRTIHSLCRFFSLIFDAFSWESWNLNEYKKEFIFLWNWEKAIKFFHKIAFLGKVSHSLSRLYVNFVDRCV